jgi:hypothetical protein
MSPVYACPAYPTVVSVGVLRGIDRDRLLLIHRRSVPEAHAHAAEAEGRHLQTAYQVFASASLTFEDHVSYADAK